MKHLKLAMICLGLALVVMVSTDVEAGRLKKPKKDARTEKTEEEMTPPRFDNYPTMDFRGGTLTRDAHSGWRIGDTYLTVAKDCVIIMETGEEGWLEEGRQAIVMGAPMGNTIAAWSIIISEPEYKKMGLGTTGELKEPGPNPNVGKIVQRAE